MNRPAHYRIVALLVSLLAFGTQLYARPINFSELSLLIRFHESEGSIRQEAAERKLQHPLTGQQESTLKAQGASDSLVQALRSSSLVASKEEAEAADALDRRTAAAQVGEPAPHHHQPHVRVFNIAYGQPINLSEFGGADYEIAFYSYRVAGEDLVEPAMVDNIRTGTDVSRTIPLVSEGETFTQSFYPTNEVRNWRFTPYTARRDLKDNRFNFSDSVATSSHSFSRPLPIDWDSPVFIEGQPYTFYRVYGAGGVSLYYIGKATDQAAMVAVVSRNGS
jgi:hypothetical protein